MRYAYHFGNNTYYDESTECLKMELVENDIEQNSDNNIIHDIDMIVKQNVAESNNYLTV